MSAKKAGRPIGQKNKPSHKAGRPSAGETVNPGRISTEAMELFRFHATQKGITIRRAIEQAAHHLVTICVK